MHIHFEDDPGFNSTMNNPDGTPKLYSYTLSTPVLLNPSFQVTGLLALSGWKSKISGPRALSVESIDCQSTQTTILIKLEDGNTAFERLSGYLVFLLVENYAIGK